jgi:hypothetical protein
MIYELRTYTLKPGRQPEYLRLHGEISRPIRGDRFGKLEGIWTSEFGVLNQVYSLWSWPDAGERQRARAEFIRDERWRGEFLPRTRDLVLRQENKLLFPVEGVPVEAPSEGGHVYELRTYRALYQRLPEWLELFRGIQPARQEYSKPVGVWTTDVGTLNEVAHLWVYDDLNHRARVRSTVLEDPRWQEFLGRATALLEEMQSVVLIPSEISPLR